MFLARAFFGRPVRAAALLSAACALAPMTVLAAGERTVRDATQPATHAAARRATVGVASVYAKKLDGNKTASGEVHDGDDLVAAHRTLPLGSEVRVTNLANRKAVVVRINDRGPAVKSRIIDLSPRAAAQIGLHARGKGVTRVRLDVLREGESPPVTASAEDRTRDVGSAAASSAR